MTNLNEALLAQTTALAEVEDQSVEQAFVGHTVPEGKAVGRLTSYIELGLQPQGEYEGKQLPDAEEVMLKFELHDIRKDQGFNYEYEKDGKTVQACSVINIRLPKKFSAKAKYRKLFKTLIEGRTDIKHLGQLLGAEFMFDVKHNEIKTGKNKGKKYPTIYVDGIYRISRPEFTNPQTDELVRIPVPPLMSNLQLFVQGVPTKEQWASIFIEGEYEKDGKKEGEKVKVSKNFIQELIMASKNYRGSRLETMLNPDAAGMEDMLAEGTQVETKEVAPVKQEVETQETVVTTTVEAEPATQPVQTAQPVQEVVKAEPVEQPVVEKVAPVDALSAVDNALDGLFGAAK